MSQLSAQFMQELRGLWQCLNWIERILQVPLRGRAWHELRDAERTLAAAGDRTDSVGAKPALLPDHTGQRTPPVGCWREPPNPRAAGTPISVSYLPGSLCLVRAAEPAAGGSSPARRILRESRHCSQNAQN